MSIISENNNDGEPIVAPPLPELTVHVVTAINWLPILLGFQKSNNLWAQSMLKNRDSNVLATVLPFDPKKKIRQEEVVQIDSLVRSKMLVHDLDFNTLKDQAWYVVPVPHNCDNSPGGLGPSSKRHKSTQRTTA
jgi:hypothetical protein